MKFRKPLKFLMYLALFGILTFVYYTSFRHVTEKNKSVLHNPREDVRKYQSDITLKEIKRLRDDCQIVTNKVNAARVSAEDPELVQLIKDCYIEAPSAQPYNLSHPEVEEQSQGQAVSVDKNLNQMEGGFFVDCGANDGEGFSNSLFLERYRNWTGILIEASPSVYKELKRKNRKAFTLNACLHTKPYPSAVTFLDDSWWGNIVEGNYSKTYKGISRQGRYVKVQCFPLHSILLALNHLTVDYFSLDVEGAEKGVLDSIPWDKLEIKMMSVEYDKWPGGKDSLKTYLEGKGYKYVTEVRGRAAADIVVLKE